VAECVHAGVDPDQQAGGDPALDGSRAQAQPQQLCAADVPVLARSEHTHALLDFVRIATYIQQ
jgi:hypothetical protein